MLRYIQLHKKPIVHQEVVRYIMLILYKQVQDINNPFKINMQIAYIHHQEYSRILTLEILIVTPHKLQPGIIKALIILPQIIMLLNTIHLHTFKRDIIHLLRPSCNSLISPRCLVPLFKIQSRSKVMKVLVVL